MHRALSSQKRRFPARAVADDEALVYQVVRVCELIEVDLADPRRPRNPRHAGFNQAGIWPGNTASNCRGQRHRTANSPTYNPVSTALVSTLGGSTLGGTPFWWSDEKRNGFTTMNVAVLEDSDQTLYTGGCNVKNKYDSWMSACREALARPGPF